MSPKTLRREKYDKLSGLQISLRIQMCREREKLQMYSAQIERSTVRVDVCVCCCLSQPSPTRSTLLDELMSNSIL